MLNATLRNVRISRMNLPIYSIAKIRKRDINPLDEPVGFWLGLLTHRMNRWVTLLTPRINLGAFGWEH
jgi:hypothetical protein